MCDTGVLHMYYMCMNYMCNTPKTPHMYYMCVTFGGDKLVAVRAKLGSSTSVTEICTFLYFNTYMLIKNVCALP